MLENGRFRVMHDWGSLRPPTSALSPGLNILLVKINCPAFEFECAQLPSFNNFPSQLCLGS